MKIYPFAALCWMNRDRTAYFSQLLKTNLLSKTTTSQAQPAFICSNSARLTLEERAKFFLKLTIEHVNGGWNTLLP